MPQFGLICLANSRKLGGRCVAGLKLDGSGWLRPIGTLPNGTLYPPDYTLNDGTEVGPLDVIQISFRGPRPAPHQPENYVIDGTSWSLLARPMSKNHVHVLQSAVLRGSELLGGFSDRVPYDSFLKKQAATSLALIAPETMDVYDQMSYRGRPQARCRFFLGSGANTYLYDLAITDPEWEKAVIQQGFRTLRQTDAKFLVTISLGEPFGLECYKFAAAIMPLPNSIASAF